MTATKTTKTAKKGTPAKKGTAKKGTAKKAKATPQNGNGAKKSAPKVKKGTATKKAPITTEKRPRIHPGNLRKPQAIVLSVLVTSQGKPYAGPKTMSQIVAETEMKPAGAVYNQVGSDDAETRAKTEARIGYPTLVGLGYVKSVSVDADGRKKTGWRITSAGLTALKKYKDAGASLEIKRKD